jgi:hypothetical protein
MFVSGFVCFVGVSSCVGTKSKLNGSFPLGLFPGNSLEKVDAVLSGEGLKKGSTTGSETQNGREISPLMVFWKMSGQVVSGAFVPTSVLGTFKQGKLVNVSLNANLATCNDLLSAYQSAASYMKDSCPLKIEPLMDKNTTSCQDPAEVYGPHIMIMDKTFSCSAGAAGSSGGYTLAVHFQDMTAGDPFGSTAP